MPVRRLGFHGVGLGSNLTQITDRIFLGWSSIQLHKHETFTVQVHLH